jgi:hypothetical protein
VRLEELGPRDEILRHLVAVAFRLHGAALVVVPRVASQRAQRVGGQGQEPLDRQPPRDVLDVRVQAAILVDDEDRRELRVIGLRAGEETPDLPAAFGRPVRDVFGADPGVVGRDLLRECVVRAEPLEQRLGRHAAHREGGRTTDEVATAQSAVRVVVVEVEQLLIEVPGLFSFHGDPSFGDDMMVIGR